MDTIYLEAIRKKIADIPGNRGEGEFTNACMKEAIHQALVLASENALANRVYLPQGGYRDTTVDKQSILDIEKLIV